MLFTIVTVICFLVFFAGMFTGGKSWREVRELFYGNYYAEDGLINQTDKPNSKEAFQNCIDNGIGIKTEVFYTKDNRLAISTYNNLAKEYGVDKNISDCDMEELEALGIMSVSSLIEMVDDTLPVIFELKGSTNNEAMCRSMADVIKASKKKNIAVCSFNAGIMSWFKEREKDIFRGIVSAPAKEFKNLPKFQRWVTGNLANNYNCRPNFMLYRNRPQSIFVKFAVTSGVLNGVWTIDNAEEAKRLQEEKELIVVRGFMPETVHFKDLPVIATPTPAATSKFAQAQEQAVRQRSISEILADDEIDVLPEQDGVFDELEAEMDQLFGEAKEKATEIIAKVKEEAVEIYDKVKEEVTEAVEDLKK